MKQTTAAQESSPSTGAFQIVASVSEMAFKTKNRARRLIHRAGEYLSKPTNQVQQVMESIKAIPGKLRSRKQDKNKRDS
jgi:hypothetical protein